MSPAEFFFLAVGLLLGLAAGAAVLDVVRARPPRPEVHLTITREALPRQAGGREGSRAGHPATAVDRADPIAPDPIATDPIATEPTLTLSTPPAPVPPLTIQARPTGRTDDRVPIRVGAGLDPTLAALRAVAREREPVLAARRTGSGIRRPFGVRAQATAGRETPGGEGMERTTGRGEGSGQGGGASGSRPSATSSGPSATGTGPSAANAGASGTAADASASPSGATRSRARGERGGSGQPPGGPCGAERLLAEERCAVASQARERADEVAAELRRAQRAYDAATARAEAASRTSDPRAVADAKEGARQKFRAASRSARTRADLEAAATAWLGEINRINHDRREASETAGEARQAAADLLGTIERLTLAADASRITAAAAASACTEARQLLADCEERAARAPGPAGRPTTAGAPGAAAPAPTAAAGAGAAGLGGAAQAPSGASALLEALQRPTEVPLAEDEAALGPLPAAPTYRGDDHQPAIFRLLQGDRQTLIEVVDRLAGSDREERQRGQQLLGEMVEAVVAGAIEACVLDFPTEHPFWQDFNRTQCRDIAVALASLGYRFDGLGGFVDARVPSQRDLSLAVGYAGLDPMRIRRWPDEAEMRQLYTEVRVAADEYLADRAPDLTLGEMVTLLGRRSEPLAELWNAWGRARPLLLAATG